MFAIRLMLLFFSLQLTLDSVALASTIITSEPIEQDVSKEFFIGTGTYLKNEKTSLRLGYFNDEKWCRVTLINNGPERVHKLIYFEALTGLINLYKEDVPNGPLSLIGTAGSSIPFAKRGFQSTLAALKITLEPNSLNTFFFKINTLHNFNSKIFVGTAATMAQQEFDRLTFVVFYAGGILCLILYNFFIFLFLKDKNYLFYSFFSLTFLMTVLNIHGVFDKVINSSTISFSDHLLSFSSATLFFATIFTYHFLKIPKFLNRSVKLFYFFAFASFALFMVGLSPLEHLYPAIFGTLIDILLLVSNLVFIFSSILLYKKTSEARFYLFSWVVVGLSLLAWFGMTFGFLPSNIITKYSLLYANLGQMLTLSLALAQRIHTVTKEKLEAEEKANKNERYQRLVKVLSHDISNSLTIINVYSKKILGSAKLETNAQSSLEKVYLAAENIKNILGNVREEILLTERKKEIDLHPVNIYETLISSTAIFEEELKRKNIKLLINVPGDLMIMANKTCFLNNIANNIISNSIKFSFDNSKIEIYSRTLKNQIELSFQDYGQGIDPLLISDIFYSNKLISSLGTGAEAGHGFGTSLMREYVKLFGGSLKVKSSVNSQNSGTCITLTFPTLPKN